MQEDLSVLSFSGVRAIHLVPPRISTQRQGDGGQLGFISKTGQYTGQQVISARLY